MRIYNYYYNAWLIFENSSIFRFFNPWSLFDQRLIKRWLIKDDQTLIDQRMTNHWSSFDQWLITWKSQVNNDIKSKLRDARQLDWFSIGSNQEPCNMSCRWQVELGSAATQLCELSCASLAIKWWIKPAWKLNECINYKLCQINTINIGH